MKAEDSYDVSELRNAIKNYFSQQNTTSDDVVAIMEENEALAELYIPFREELEKAWSGVAKYRQNAMEAYEIYYKRFYEQYISLFDVGGFIEDIELAKKWKDMSPNSVMRQKLADSSSDMLWEHIKQLEADPGIEVFINAEIARYVGPVRRSVYSIPLGTDSPQKAISVRDVAFNAVRKELLLQWFWDELRKRESNKNSEEYDALMKRKQEYGMDEELLASFVCLAKKADTGEKVLREIAELYDDEDEILDAIWDNPGLSEYFINVLARHSYGWVRFSVAKHTNDPKLLRLLSKDEDYQVRGAIVDNKYTPIEILYKQIEDENSNVLLKLAKNPRLPLNVRIELLRRLAEDEDSFIRGSVARHPDSPADVLYKLSGDADSLVREDLTENPNTPTDILRKLASDADVYVRIDVARSLYTPVDALCVLAEDLKTYVRAAVAKNVNTPTNILSKLAEDTESEVRKEVVYNPNTPIEVLFELINDESEEVKICLACVHTSPAELLCKLSKNENWLVRDAAATNPNTPTDILNILTKDENEYVRKAAEESLKKSKIKNN